MPDKVASQFQITPKRRMVIDYMRGNGGRLTSTGRDHLVARGSFANLRSVSNVVVSLGVAGLIEPAADETFDFVLTERGKRV